MSPGHYKYVRDLPWPYDFRSHLVADYAAYRQSGTSAYTKMTFDQVANWAQKYGISPGRVFVGEFGVLRSTKDTTGAPRPDAAKWIGNMARESANHGFAWAAFDLDTAFAVDCGKLPNENLCEEYRAAFDHAAGLSRDERK